MPIKMTSAYGGYTSGQTITLSDQNEINYVERGVAIYANLPATSDAKLSLDPVTGAVLGVLGPDGASLSTLGSDVFTVGAGGRYSTLQDAIAARSALSHTTVALGLTGNVTGTSSGTVSVKELVLTTNSLTAYIGKMVGFRLTDSTNPIVRGFVTKANTIRALYPFVSDFASVSVDVFEIRSACVYFLPGTHLTLPAATPLTIPAFTTLYAHKNTASIQMPDAATYLAASGSQNEIFIDGLGLRGPVAEVPWSGNTFVWWIPTSVLNANQRQCDFGIANSDCDFGHVDGIMFGNNVAYGGKAGGFYMRNTKQSGYYDLLRAVTHRNLLIHGNTFDARATYYDLTKDATSSCIAIGSGTPNFPDEYPIQEYHIYDNQFRINSDDLFAVGTWAQARPIEVRNQLATVTRMFIRDNYIYSRVSGGNAASYGFIVSVAGGTQTPFISVTGNAFDVTNGGTGVATTLHSANANYIINAGENTVCPNAASLIGSNVTGRNRALSVAYAATVTPNVNVAEVHNIGILTGAITVNDPTNPQIGQRLTLNYIQDATGGRVITYGTAFKASTIAAAAASTKGSHSFVYDGTNWVQSGGTLIWL